MKKDLFLWQFAGFSLSTLAGSLLHFLYEWTNGSIITAPFSAVNESTWEHMKLIFFPLFVFALIQSRFFGECKGFWWVKLSGILTSLALIPVLFYTYNGAFGKSPDWLNIAFFFVAAAVGFLLETVLFKNDLLRLGHNRIPLFIVLIIAVSFFIFTFAPPKLPVFEDPLTGGYGV